MAKNPAQARDLPPDEAWDLLVRATALIPLLMVAAHRKNGHSEPEASEDRLLRVPEVAERLGVSEDTVYRKRWPFEHRGGTRGRRFSANALERYLRQRTGRG